MTTSEVEPDARVADQAESPAGCARDPFSVGQDNIPVTDYITSVGVIKITYIVLDTYNS
jgi:hypothetical protein